VGAADEGVGPVAVEKEVGVGDWDLEVVEWEVFKGAAAFGGVLAAALLDEEVFHGSEKVAAETAAGRIGGFADGFAREKIFEKGVSQITGTFLPAGPMFHEGMYGFIVDRAQFGQRHPRNLAMTTRAMDERPAGGME